MYIFFYGIFKDNPAYNKALLKKISQGYVDAALYSIYDGAFPAMVLGRPGKVLGTIYEFTEEEAEKILDVYDRVEGIHLATPLYTRVEVFPSHEDGQPIMHNGEPVRAWAYVVRPESRLWPQIKDENLIPSGIF